MTTMLATAVLLTFFALDNFGLLGSAASGEPPKSLPANIYGTNAFNEESVERKSHTDNLSEPNYYSDDDDGDDDDDYTDNNNGRERNESEDQLDQDDPVSTVTVTAVRGSVTLLPCDIGGGNNDGLPRQTKTVVLTNSNEDKSNTLEDRAYMVLWFKHRYQSTIRHRNTKSKKKKISSGGKPLYSFDVRGRPLAHALKWSSDEVNGGFGPRASFIVFSGSAGERGRWTEQRLSLDSHGVNDDNWLKQLDESVLYDNSSKAALRIMNVTEQDAGAYRCRVDFRDSPTRNYRIILRVIVPPDKITIVYNGETEIDGGTHHVIGPVPEGGQLVLVCKVQGGKPKPRVQWYSADGKVTTSLNTGTMDLTEEESFSINNDDENITTNKLMIHKLNRSHANSTYTCLAGNDDNTIESSLRMTVLINMYLNVKNVRILDIHPTDESENIINYNDDGSNNGVLQRINLVSGKWYTVECWSEGASPKATIEWSIDGNGTLAGEIPSAPTMTRITVIEKTEHSSRIRFRPTPSDDGRYLRCHAWNPDINMTKDNIKNKALLLNVLYPPIVKLSLGHTFDPSRIKTGDDVYFECKVLDGSDNKRKQRNSIEWYHNGHSMLQHGIGNGSVSINLDTKVVLLSAGTLVIRNVGRHHSGRYTCQCSNDLGIGRSLPVILRVQYAPVCIDDDSQMQLVGVEKTENSIRVMCRVRADPADDHVQFEWLVWPGTATTELQQSPVPVAAGNYVTTALSGSARNGTTAGMVIGELVLPATAVGAVSDTTHYADRTLSARKPIVLDTVSCRATNAVGRQQDPCIYHIIPASPPGALIGCEIRLPKDQEHYVSNGNTHKRQRATSFDNDAEYKDTATINCKLGSDGGVRPVTYWLEVYESSVLLTSFSGSTEEITDFNRNKYRSEWLVENITGTVMDNKIEYRVNRKSLQLKINPNENRKYLSMSAYASNRIGRGPQTYFGSENSFLLQHPWWWHSGSTEESSTAIGQTGTSSTEWWILLGGGDDRHSNSVKNGDSRGNDKDTTTSIVIISILAMITMIVIVCILLWKRRRRLWTTTETTISANLIATNNHPEHVEKSNKNYTHLLSQQQLQGNIYPNLNSSNDLDDNCDSVRQNVAPDIMAHQNYGKLQCLVSIADHGIPGPESCV